MKLDIFIGFIFSFFVTIAYGASTDSFEEELAAQAAPAKVGNFILPPSLQPGVLVSFGDKIIDQNETIVFLLADEYKGVNKRFNDIVPSVLYGITNNFSVSFNMPIAPSYKEDQQSSSGLEDAFLQFEYAFYGKSTHNYVDQATIVSNVTYPSGSTTKQPTTGIGAPSFFLGVTFNRMYTDWFLFTSHGVGLTTSANNTKFGNQFLYQAGLGRNIFDIDTRWIFAWVLEADGQYTQKNKISGITDPNSGGNIVYVTPSLWISSKKLIVQPGVGLPVVQTLYGNQRKTNYFLILSLGWRL